ncbi:hypothetical protein C8F04DRAFT_965726 [Mycena alexandri]|uniref:CxC2-like cysteine cluster KDZ transposase-associated domain-containing protein n=1 Tax=Mycena alexandri TaxID=1745969 RepID=A0AAD6SG38_9AGAR|nr:hypothetical protein C8F04DRAFT_965726 [Mycena alexandri]
MYLAEVLRLEGRGDHIDFDKCARCQVRSADHRCSDCLAGGELLCASCLVEAHRQLPLHRVEYWTGSEFERKTLKSMGLRIQLGHWTSFNRLCSVPTPASGDDFIIVDSNGVHEVGLDFCGCGQAELPTVQLLRGRLWAATTTNPKTAATFAVLRRYQILSFESKCSTQEFYESLARLTDNLQHKKNRNKDEENARLDKKRDRYPSFLLMMKQWRVIQMLKRAACGHDPLGLSNVREGQCALLCPACPQPGKNMSVGWQDAPPDKQFLHALFLAIDANFRLKRKDVSSEEKDPGLGRGWAFYAEVVAYMKHVRKHWKQKQDRSHCVAHDAVDKPDREACGTASSGVGAVDCARHNMKRPSAVGDLQLGERYINMDYIFFRSVAGTELVRLFVSYDIACQWHIHLWSRMEQYENELLVLPGFAGTHKRFVTFLVPKFHLPAHIEACNLKFSFNLTRDVGQTDGEAPERGWANANPLAASTKEMGPGTRRDTLDDHFNDWNHKKTIGLGYQLRKKMLNAVPEMVKTRLALSDMEESLGAEPVAEWTEMAEKWEASSSSPNPFETQRKDEHLAKVRGDLAAEAAQREAEGGGDASDVKGDMHITELLAMGLQLEEQQRTLGFDVAATGLHPTNDQRRAMIERTSKLRRKIFAWIEVQMKFFPGVADEREQEDNRRARAAEAEPVPGLKVSDIALWLPSAIVGAGGCSGRVVCKDEVLEHEYRLRVGQAHETLHEVRRLLLVRTHLYKLKDTHARGVRANTRSADKIAALNDRVKRAAAGYRTARAALVSLGGVLKRRDWEWELLPLREEDVRGLPPKRAKITREERELSWIWISRGSQAQPGDDAAMNEAVRIEWAKARARAMRWREEVDLLEEEMQRVRRFLVWREGWWMEQVGRKRGLDVAEAEGETAYAKRQAGVQRELRRLFDIEWDGLPDLVAAGRLGGGGG